MSYVVGLTGGIGSGKTTIANLFAALGVPLVDADVVARQIVEEGSPLLTQIADHFGAHILTESGSLNRTLLRQIIFEKPAEKTWLNELLHPAIRQEMLRQLAEIDAPYVLWVVPLLLENKLANFCDRILVIDVDPEIQLQRACARDQSNLAIIQNIMRAQVDRTTRLAAADDIIENNIPLEKSQSDLQCKVASLHQQYLFLAQQKEQICQSH